MMVSCADCFIKKQWEQVKPLPGLKANTPCHIRGPSPVLPHPAPVSRELAEDLVKLAFAKEGEGVLNPYIFPQYRHKEVISFSQIFRGQKRNLEGSLYFSWREVEQVFFPQPYKIWTI